MRKTNTIEYLKQLAELTERSGKKEVNIGMLRVPVMTITNIWLPQLEKETEAEQLGPIIQEGGKKTRIRQIRPSALLSFYTNSPMLWTPIMYEVKKDGRMTKGKTHGGQLEINGPEGFSDISELCRELDEEGLFGMYEVLTESIKPIGVLTSPEGRILPFYHARLRTTPPPAELRNPVTKTEKLRGKYYILDDLSAILAGLKDETQFPEEIHQETIEMIMTENLWERSSEVSRGRVPLSIREEILRKADIDLDPKQVLKEYKAYFSLPRIKTRPFLPKARLFINTGIFLYEKQFSIEETDIRPEVDPKEFQIRAYHFIKRYAEDKFEELLTEKLLEAYLIRP